ncbi:Up-regulated during septation-domain-containing protein [Glomus cerebriforme]|uniref:Up-regulated during septation-domain-containing protein n=1 Tax=Glomus cerebriforme TaxID=658196 RepID=A0A397T7C2_9GLOM|nr:Up-regulated during septation-domain-containing protein [Glomus cerebriforme]
MSSSNNNSFIKRKPVPIESEQDYGNSSFTPQTSKTDKPTDLSFLNQAPRAPAKSPLRHSNSAGSIGGNQNASATPISSSTQTTILQPVMSTMTITSAPTVPTKTASNPSITSKNSTIRSRPSVDTASLNSISIERDLPSLPENEYEESIKSNQTYNSKRRGSEQSTNSPTSLFPITSDLNSNTSNNVSSPPKVKLSSLAITNDLIASSEAILSLNTPKFPGSTFLDTADEMLMQILISQAVIDSKDFEILSLEEVEELKKDHSLLTTRIAALTSRLSLESKIREAASSLARLHASNKRLSRQATDHLATANRKVDQVATELWKLTQRAGEVQRKLLQHMAGVLSLGIRKLEEKNSQHPPFSPNLPQLQATEGSNGIDNLFNEIMGINDNSENSVSDPALLEKVSNLENALQNVHQTLAETRMALKRRDKEIEELKIKVDDTAAEVRERTIAELRTELEEIGSRLDIVLRKHKANDRENNIGSGSDNEESDEPYSGTSSFYRLSTMTTATQHLQKEQYKNIEENLSALEKALEDYMFKIYKMEQELSSVKNKSYEEIKTLQNRLQEATNDMHQSQEALKTERIKNSNTENEINELREKVKIVRDLEGQIKDMEQRHREKGVDENNFNVNLELKLKQTTREYEEMMDHLKQLFKFLPDVNSNDQQNQNGSSNLNKNKFGVDEFINRVRAIGEENRRLHDQTTLLQSRLERINEQMVELKEQDSIKQELRDTQQELEETKAKLADLEDKAQSTKSRVQSTNERENELRNELESLREQLTTNKEKVRKFEAIMKRQSVLQVVNDGTTIKEEFQQQLAAQEQEYEAQLKERDIVITKLRNDLTNTVTEKDNVSQTVRDLEEMLKSKTRTLDQREVTINRLESDIVRYKSELAELKAATDGERRFNDNSGGNSGVGDTNNLKKELEAAHEELKHLRNVKDKLEAQLRQSKDALEKTKSSFSEREAALEKSSETTQAELDGILKEFDRLTRNFLDFDSERQKLQNALDNLQRKCEKLENELADEKLKNMGMDAVSEPTTTATLRKEFRKMMADLRDEQQKLLHREMEEKKKLENTVRNLKREKEAEKWERANKGTQTRFVVSVSSG